jgi:hypothetical protein
VRAAPAATSAPAEPRRLRTAVDAALALSGVEEAAEDWGGTWDRNGNGGLLRLPVQAGLRHGLLDVAVTATEVGGGGTDLAFNVQEETWRVHRPAAGLLVVAGAGGIATALCPFFPALVPFTPLGIVLGVGAWLVVLSRLRNVGLAELVEDVEGRLAGLDEPEASDAPAAAG